MFGRLVWPKQSQTFSVNALTAPAHQFSGLESTHKGLQREHFPDYRTEKYSHRPAWGTFSGLKSTHIGLQREKFSGLKSTHIGLQREHFPD